jgi:hypothetical protein
MCRARLRSAPYGLGLKVDDVGCVLAIDLILLMWNLLEEK